MYFYIIDGYLSHDFSGNEGNNVFISLKDISSVMRTVNQMTDEIIIILNRGYEIKLSGSDFNGENSYDIYNEIKHYLLERDRGHIC